MDRAWCVVLLTVVFIPRRRDSSGLVEGSLVPSKRNDKCTRRLERMSHHVRSATTEHTMSMASTTD